MTDFNNPLTCQWRIKPGQGCRVEACDSEDDTENTVVACTNTSSFAPPVLQAAEIAKFIVAAHNACLSLNPSNPLAAAAGLVGLVEAAEKLVKALDRERVFLSTEILSDNLAAALAAVRKGE
jgi:hypothetical protein